MKYIIPIILLFIFPSLLKAQNLVDNGSFTIPASGWTYFAPATGTENWASETSYGGSNSSNGVAEVAGESNLRQANIPVVSGQTYLVSFKTSRRTGNGAAAATVGVSFKVYDANNTYIFDSVYSNNTTFNLTCHNYTFVATSNSVTVDVANISAVYSTLGTVIDDITITPQNQTITFSGNSCQGSAFSLSAPYYPADSNDNNYHNWSWTGPNSYTSTDSVISFSPTTANMSGTYTCTMTLNTCLSVTGSYSVTINPSDSSINKAICAGESFDFYGNQLTQSGTYDTLIPANTTNGCDMNVTLHLTVNPIPDASLVQKDSASFCEGKSYTLSVNSPYANGTYQWYRDGNPLTGQTSTSWEPTTAGDYNFKVTLNGCTNLSDTIKLIVNPNPTVDIVNLAGNEINCAGDTTTLYTSYDATYSYFWSPNSIFNINGANSDTARLVVTTASQSVNLTVYNQYGCSTQDSIVVYTQPCCAVTLPSAFSPNGDGVNDVFRPLSQVGQLINNFSIYNRYGQRLYNGVGNNVSWNGKTNDGKDLNVGTYMYYLEYTCSDNKTYTKKGDVTLVR